MERVGSAGSGTGRTARSYPMTEEERFLHDFRSSDVYEALQSAMVLLYEMPVRPINIPKLFADFLEYGPECLMTTSLLQAELCYKKAGTAVVGERIKALEEKIRGFEGFEDYDYQRQKAAEAEAAAVFASSSGGPNLVDDTSNDQRDSMKLRGVSATSDLSLPGGRSPSRTFSSPEGSISDLPKPSSSRDSKPSSSRDSKPSSSRGSKPTSSSDLKPSASHDGGDPRKVASTAETRRKSAKLSAVDGVIRRSADGGRIAGLGSGVGDEDPKYVSDVYNTLNLEKEIKTKMGVVEDKHPGHPDFMPLKK